MASVSASLMSDNPAVDRGNFITSPEVLAAKVAEWNKKGWHVLSPAVQVSTFAPGYGINASLVLLGTEVDERGRGLAGSDTYFDAKTMKGDERGPSKIGLGKIASAAGVSWIAGQSGRRDPFTIQNLWIYQIVGVYLATDGTPQVIHGEKEIDYRDGSAMIHGWSENRVLQGRVSGAERAETGAMERAIRMGFAIKHVYTLAELAQPFVALRVCPLVDMTDPAVKNMVTAGKIAGVAALYAGTARRELPDSTGADVIDISTVRRPEPVPVAASTPVAPPRPVAAPVQAAPSAPAAAPPVTPPSSPTPASETAPANFIREVTLEKKQYGAQHAKAGQGFIKYHVIDGNGVEHMTIRTKLGELAQKAAKEKFPVLISSVPNRFQELEIANIEPYKAAAPVVPASELKL